MSNAHVDKQAFLLALSKFGESPEKDLELVRRITGAKVELKERDNPLTGTTRSYTAFVQLLDKDRIAGNTWYSYGVGREGQHVAALNINVGMRNECLRYLDLFDTLGVPTEIIRTSRSPHAKKTGPSDIWGVRYSFLTGAVAGFSFDTHECARNLTLRVNLK